MTATAAVEKAFRPTIVVPSLPPIDKYVAFWKARRNYRAAGIDCMLDFCARNYPTIEQMEKWDRGVPGSCVLVDVGAHKYHGRFPSATAAERSASPTIGRIWDRLVPVMNVQNRTGFLRRVPKPIANMVREFPHVFIDRETGQATTWAYGMSVIDAIFQPQNKREWSSLHTDPAYADLKATWDGFRHDENWVADKLPDSIKKELAEEVVQVNATYADAAIKLEDVYRVLDAFTLPGYLKRMFLAGDDISRIQRIMSWWLDKKEDCRKMLEAAKAKRMRIRTFQIGKEKAVCGLFHADNYFEAKHFAYKHIDSKSNPFAIGITRMPGGGVLIKTSRHHVVDMAAVFAKLEREEPGQWYIELRFENGAVSMAMNRSWQFVEVVPTAFTDGELISLITENVKYVGRVQAEA